jgi:hypothetical protein
LQTSDQTWIRVGSVAKDLGLSTQAVRDLIRSGKLEGSKDPEGRWLIDAASAAAYLATHGRRKPDAASVERIERRLDELAQAVATLKESNTDAANLVEAAERERDRYRTDAATARGAALRLVGSAEEKSQVVESLLKILQQQEAALLQLLAPGSLDDLPAVKEAAP